MGYTEAIAFQVPEELFQKIKDYLQRNNMTQEEFMLWLRTRSNAIWCSVVNVSPKNADEATDDYDEQKKAAISTIPPWITGKLETE